MHPLPQSHKIPILHTPSFSSPVLGRSAPFLADSAPSPCFVLSSTPASAAYWPVGCWIPVWPSDKNTFRRRNAVTLHASFFKVHPFSKLKVQTVRIAKTVDHRSFPFCNKQASYCVDQIVCFTTSQGSLLSELSGQEHSQEINATPSSKTFQDQLPTLTIKYCTAWN